MPAVCTAPLTGGLSGRVGGARCTDISHGAAAGRIACLTRYRDPAYFAGSPAARRRDRLAHATFELADPLNAEAQQRARVPSRVTAVPDLRHRQLQRLGRLLLGLSVQRISQLERG